MVLENSVGLELYIATPILDKEQYLDSNLLLALVKGTEIEKKMEVTQLDSLDDIEGPFDLKKDPRLPFLVCVYNDETGIVLEYSGLTNVIDALDSLSYCGITKYDV